ncbi:ABC transporter substrate-binding protein [Klenkia taihuensis]|uniref:Xylobiose transport system substrate-binding protein n=1 Tax=Klenkia taihuensis TaxID=1225127 RepID=A0A1I1U464_9ACTN|nr:extracellular solute-binding protein [Klenkia taihuensis]GHE06947.1 sugar-binding protein [Klenkia taihuensis]SFD65494.1 xylobiose transport system substrate-binding protein [Klenkia taihuensis]
MNRSRWTRTLFASGAALAVAVSATGCGGGSTEASSPTGDASFWTLQDPTNTVQQAGIDAFNETGDGTVTLDAVPSDGYLDKLRVSMGSGQAPDMFFSWGGGPMREYAEADRIVDIASLPGAENLADQFLPSVLQAGSSDDGTVFGIPCRGTQPVFLFYNKQVFADAGVEPPTTMSDLQDLVGTFQDRGITPIALAGESSSSWTELMWLSYLTDRIGGPEVFQRIESGEEDAWRDPAVLQAAETIQDLVDSGAFGTNFGSVGYGAGGSSTLVSSGQAAMQLMGSWEYAVQQEASADFAANGLGYVPFPAVEGGAGDPDNIVGNPTNYVSVTSGAPSQTAADYLETLTSDEYVQGLVDLGEVPVTANAEEALASAPNPDYARFQFDLVANAPTFTQSWDQALGFEIATPMLAALQELFNGQQTPEQFVDTVAAI